MKLKHILIGSTIALTALCSCEDFLDVRPKQELVEGELFKSASGFEDAIYGVYGSPANHSPLREKPHVVHE